MCGAKQLKMEKKPVSKKVSADGTFQTLVSEKDLSTCSGKY